MPNTRYNALLALALATLITACSSTPTATMDFNPDFDFSVVEKVAIQPIHRTVESQTILSDMQIGRVDASLTAELERRGFEVVESNADADLLLAWHLVTQERTDIRTFNTSTRYNCWNCRRMGMSTGPDVSVRQYTQGTFIVDMIDPAGLQAVWRSVFQSRMRNHSDPARAAEARDAAVTAALADFPPP